MLSLLAEIAWLERFRAYSTVHLVVAVVCFALIAGACVLGRRLRGTPRERVLRHSWAWFTLAFQGAALLWWMIPENDDPHRTIPLQLCRIVAFVAPVALLIPAAPLRAILFFWGLGLCSQAFCTPVYREGLAHPAFWFFWLGHVQIVGSALYDTVVLGYRPVWRDYLFITGLGVVYLAAVIPINLAYDFNFGYLGRGQHDVRTAADYLPPWPWRPLFIFLAAQAVMTALWLMRRPRGLGAGFTGAPGVRPPSTPAPSTAPLR